MYLCDLFKVAFELSCSMHLFFQCCVYLEKSERLKMTSRSNFFPQKLVVDDEVSVENKNRSQVLRFLCVQSKST